MGTVKPLLAAVELHFDCFVKVGTDLGAVVSSCSAAAAQLQLKSIDQLAVRKELAGQCLEHLCSPKSRVELRLERH